MNNKIEVITMNHETLESIINIGVKGLTLVTTLGAVYFGAQAYRSYKNVRRYCCENGGKEYGVISGLIFGRQLEEYGRILNEKSKNE